MWERMNERQGVEEVGGGCFALRKYRNYAWVLVHILYILKMSFYINTTVGLQQFSVKHGCL